MSLHPVLCTKDQAGTGGGVRSAPQARVSDGHLGVLRAPTVSGSLRKRIAHEHIGRQGPLDGTVAAVVGGWPTAVRNVTVCAAKAVRRSRFSEQDSRGLAGGSGR